MTPEEQLLEACKVYVASQSAEAKERLIEAVWNLPIDSLLECDTFIANRIDTAVIQDAH